MFTFNIENHEPFAKNFPKLHVQALKWQQSYWSMLPMVRPLDGNIPISALEIIKCRFRDKKTTTFFAIKLHGKCRLPPA